MSFNILFFNALSVFFQNALTKSRFNDNHETVMLINIKIVKIC